MTHTEHTLAPSTPEEMSDMVSGQYPSHWLRANPLLNSKNSQPIETSSVAKHVMENTLSPE